MRRQQICSRIRGRRRRKTILPDGLDDNRMVGNLEWVESQADSQVKIFWTENVTLVYII